MTVYFHVVSSVGALNDALKSHFFGLTPLASVIVSVHMFLYMTYVARIVRCARGMSAYGTIAQYVPRLGTLCIFSLRSGHNKFLGHT